MSCCTTFLLAVRLRGATRFLYRYRRRHTFGVSYSRLNRFHVVLSVAHTNRFLQLLNSYYSIRFYDALFDEILSYYLSHWWNAALQYVLRLSHAVAPLPLCTQLVSVCPVNRLSTTTTTVGDTRCARVKRTTITDTKHNHLRFIFALHN